MKKTITLLILACVFTSISFSQSIGLKLGLNRANMYLENDGAIFDTSKPFNSFHAGLVAEYPLAKRFSVELGLLWSYNGYRYNKTTSEFKFVPSPSGFQEMLVYSVDERSLRLSYLNIPLSLKIAQKVETGRIYLSIGGYYSFGLKGKNKITQGETTTLNSLEATETAIWEEADDDLRNSDYGITFGAGIDIHAFTFGFMYNLGLVNLAESAEGFLYSDMKNRAFNISVGYRLGS